MKEIGLQEVRRAARSDPVTRSAECRVMADQDSAVGRRGAGRLGAPCFRAPRRDCRWRRRCWRRRVLRLAVGAAAVRQGRAAGPGFFPFVLGVVLGLMALAILFRACARRGGGEAVYLGHRDVLVVLRPWSAWRWPSRRRRLPGARRLHGRAAAARCPHSLWRALLGAGLGMVAVWAVFRVALGVRLPAGEFWDALTGLHGRSTPEAVSDVARSTI